MIRLTVSVSAAMPRLLCACCVHVCKSRIVQRCYFAPHSSAIRYRNNKHQQDVQCGLRRSGKSSELISLIANTSNMCGQKLRRQR
eukprot:2605-Heterococcus_DN1.PRE.1